MPAELVLLKLHVGGPQYAWDISQLLNGGDRELLIGEVGKHLAELPGECAALWGKIVEG